MLMEVCVVAGVKVEFYGKITNLTPILIFHVWTTTNRQLAFPKEIEKIFSFCVLNGMATRLVDFSLLTKHFLKYMF